MSGGGQAVNIEAQNHAPATRDALTRNIGFDVLARIGYLVSRVFIPPFVLARIGLAAYSLWSAVFIVVSYVGISSLGFSAAYVKYVAENVARGDVRKANALLSTGIVLCVVVCGVMYGLLVLSLPMLLLWFKVPPSLYAEAREVILLVVGLHACDIIFSVFPEALSGTQKIAEVQAIWVITYTVEAILVFALVGSGHGVVGLAEAFAVRCTLSIVLSAALAYWLLPWLHISPRLCNRASLRELVSFGGVVQLGALLATALNTIERIIAAPLIGLEAVGLLDLGDKLPQMAGSIPAAFAASFMPAAAYLQGGLENTPQGRETIGKLYLKGARYMNLASSAIAGFLAMGAAPLLSVWIGGKYPATIYLMTIFAVQQQVHLLTGPGTSILRGLGRPWEEYLYTISNFIAVAITIPLCWFLFGGWSAAGLGTAVVAATVISATIFIMRANYLFEVSWSLYLRYVIGPGLIPYLIAALFAHPAWTLVMHEGRWRGAAIIGVAAALYGVTLLLVIDRLVLQKDERQWFHAMVQNQWRRRFG